MQTIKCFEVLGHTDTTEGRGPMKVVARFSHRLAAEDYVDSPDYLKWCVWGTRGESDKEYNIKEVIITILDSHLELQKSLEEEKKEKALKKLTEEEKKLLGLL